MISKLKKIEFFPWFVAGIAILIFSVSLGTFSLQFTSNMRMVLILSLWFFALLTFTLPLRYQVTVLWVFLPFVDFLKRLVFLAPEPADIHMYLILATQDIVLVMVLIKLVASAMKQPVKIRWNKGDIVFILFAIYCTFSALITPNTSLTIQTTVIGMWVWPMIAYFVYGHLWSDFKSVHRITFLTISLGLIVAVYGIQQFFNGMLPHEVAWYLGADTSINVHHMQHEAARGTFRTFSTLDSHSSYGIFLGINLVLLWAVRERIGIFFWLASSLVVSVGLILSFTRFTWLMPVLAAAFIFIFTYRRIRPLIDFNRLRRATILLLIVIGSFFIFYQMMSYLYSHGLGAISNPYLRRALTTGTLSDRLQASDLLLTTTRISFLGDGLGSGGFFAKKFGYETTNVNYHNIFIDMVESIGVIGLFLFVLFLYYSFKQILWNIHHEPSPYARKLLIALFGLILGMITVGHFNGAVFYFGRALPIYFWGILGILTHYRSASPPIHTVNSAHGKEVDFSNI